MARVGCLCMKLTQVFQLKKWFSCFQPILKRSSLNDVTKISRFPDPSGTIKWMFYLHFHTVSHKCESPSPYLDDLIYKFFSRKIFTTSIKLGQIIRLEKNIQKYSIFVLLYGTQIGWKQANHTKEYLFKSQISNTYCQIVGILGHF